MRKQLIMGVALAMLPFLTFAQNSLEGTWKSSITADDGTTVEMTSEVTGNSYSIDVDGDGTFDSEGKYILEEDKLTIWEPNSECTAKGVYTLTMTDDEFTMERIEDGCEGRGGDGTMVWTKVK